MKLVVVGIGQCGGRIADEFVRLNKRAHRQRGIEIIVDAFAVNTDAADLAGLTTIKADHQRRILIGAGRTHGHGVAKISELGAEIAKEDSDKVIEAMRTNERLFEADAFLVVGSAAGGTGSGVTPVMVKVLKERYMDRPVYALVVLPFEHEEDVEDRALYNTALCLKAVSSVADAVILVDNQRYIRKDTSLKSNMTRINEMIVEPFYNLLCAGEEQKAKYIGTRMLDTGDIKYTLSGWTAIGFGITRLPKGNMPWEKPPGYMRKSWETQKGIQVMDEAISEMSIACKPVDAGRALFLLTAPAKEMSVDLVKELCDFLKNISPQAIIRNGDYPREKGRLGVTVVLSQLGDVAKVREYYKRSTGLVKEFSQRKKELSQRQQADEEAARDVPTLL